MTTGVLRVDGVEAVLTADGWRAPDPALAHFLNAAFPLSGSSVGDPVCRAFDAAARRLGPRAAVVSHPEPTPLPPGAVS